MAQKDARKTRVSFLSFFANNRYKANAQQGWLRVLSALLTLATIAISIWRIVITSDNIKVASRRQKLANERLQATLRRQRETLEQNAQRSRQQNQALQQNAEQTNAQSEAHGSRWGRLRIQT